MNLDDELRSTFERQAQTRIPPSPDLECLVRGGRQRRRRRNLRWSGAGVAAAVLLGAGGYGVVVLGATTAPGVASRPVGGTSPTPLSTADEQLPSLAPTTYRVVVGTAATRRTMEADITVDGDNWVVEDDFPRASERSESAFAGVGVYQPSLLGAGTGCHGDARTTGALGTPVLLAQQLAQLPRSTVLVAPTRVRAFGRTVLHLRLRIDVECPSYYRVAETPVGARGITYTALGLEDVVIDFWVLNVAGTVIVVDEWHNVNASYALTSQAARARASVDLIVSE